MTYAVLGEDKTRFIKKCQKGTSLQELVNIFYHPFAASNEIVYAEKKISLCMVESVTAHLINWGIKVLGRQYCCICVLSKAYVYAEVLWSKVLCIRKKMFYKKGVHKLHKFLHIFFHRKSLLIYKKIDSPPHRYFSSVFAVYFWHFFTIIYFSQRVYLFKFKFKQFLTLKQLEQSFVCWKKSGE